MDLTGAVGLVTGGATGIGRAVCLELARAGAKGVAVNYSRSVADATATKPNTRLAIHLRRIQRSSRCSAPAL